MLKKSFKINSSIYSSKNIKEAINDYSEITKIVYDKWILVIEWENESEITEIFNEFMNYVIWLYNESN